MIADAVHSYLILIPMWSYWLVFASSANRSTANMIMDTAYSKPLATAFIGLALLVVGVGIFWQGVKENFLNFSGTPWTETGSIALVAAVVSVILKEWLYRYTVKVGNEIGSQAVVAIAWHHRSDAFPQLGRPSVSAGRYCWENAGGFWIRWRRAVSFFIVKVAFSIVVDSARNFPRVRAGGRSRR
jgi:divalent metal cation (Fe/Co/Zn/Cd) transporter